MPPIGVMIYGYNEGDADKIKVILDPILKDDVIILSASEKEDMLVDEILKKGPEPFFENKETKIMMFLGMEQEQVMSVVKDFPREGKPARPIFCTLTPNNINWKLEYLIEHLLEEEEAARL